MNLWYVRPIFLVKGGSVSEAVVNRINQGRAKERRKRHEVFSTSILYSRGLLGNDQKTAEPR
jgi:hypothetical protein